MAGTSKGLGKGLGALMGDDMMELNDEKSSLMLPISQVESCAAQPRKLFDPDALADLADSIRQHGIIQPLTVRKLQSGYYQIIAGERRWRAARMAGLTQVPAVVIEADDRKAMELAMIENLQREDLNPIEEAEGYKAETVAAAEAEAAVFTAVYEKYRSAPEITRTRLMIETLEKVLSGSGKLYLTDGAGTTKLLTLEDVATAQEAAATLE